MHRDKSGIYIRGHVKIYDPLDNTVLVDKDNSIHYENMSISLAESIGNEGQGPVYKMAFGNGGSIVDSSGGFSQGILPGSCVRDMPGIGP